MKAEAALQDLVTELDRCIDELARARRRAEELLTRRRSGHTWTEIVSGEARPLVVERISTVLASLARVGSAWRREQAAALQAEDVSINRIAAMFGVTRQRISALLREREDPPSDETPGVDI
jgi:CRP-like cAMP-binding protein